MSWEPFKHRMGKNIPPILHQEKEKRPFGSCSDCGETLKTAHYVFKSFSRLSLQEEPKQLLEIALCDACMIRLGSGISEKTMENLQKLKEKYPKLGASHLELFLDGEEVIEDRCVITGKRIDELMEYSVNGLIIGNQLIGDIHIMGDEGLREYEECLSPETQGLEDDLLNRILDLPPEIEDLFKDRSPVIL